MTAATCLLAWFFMFADLHPSRGTDFRAPVERSAPFAERAECEAIARAVEQISHQFLVYEFAPGRRCVQAPR